MKNVDQKVVITNFKKQLANYKLAIDTDIASYSEQVKHSTLPQYGANARISTDAFLDFLQSGGKRIRGSLVLVGYQMLGGHDQKMAMQAARAIEMLNTYILIIDDIQDRSESRRGGPTVHVSLADYHQKHHLGGDAAHFGVSIALNAALTGAHAAQMLLANLPVDESLRIKVMSIVNRTMVVTAHGQTSDIMNEVSDQVTNEDIDRVLEWKTAHYTFLNPLHVGMVLAGADCGATDAITDYAMHAGRAFQISDDILGIFSSEMESGKSPMDDIREGKQTLLTSYALEHASQADQNFLIQMLGKSDLSPVEFKRCQDILISSGALANAQKQARQHVIAAERCLDGLPQDWDKQSLDFLRGLAAYLLVRTA